MGAAFDDCNTRADACARTNARPKHSIYRAVFGLGMLSSTGRRGWSRLRSKPWLPMLEWLGPWDGERYTTIHLFSVRAPRRHRTSIWQWLLRPIKPAAALSANCLLFAKRQKTEWEQQCIFARCNRTEYTKACFSPRQLAVVFIRT